ncbi:hypothetical protein HY468_04500 [Candidatus Roizmanbacteria bacterium]|nr:hypothetical protein [Candidatus Roizmanbacteria bacterium]
MQKNTGTKWWRRLLRTTLVVLSTLLLTIPFDNSFQLLHTPFRLQYVSVLLGTLLGGIPAGVVIGFIQTLFDVGFRLNNPVLYTETIIFLVIVSVFTVLRNRLHTKNRIFFWLIITAILSVTVIVTTLIINLLWFGQQPHQGSAESYVLQKIMFQLTNDDPIKQLLLISFVNMAASVTLILLLRRVLNHFIRSKFWLLGVISSAVFVAWVATIVVIAYPQVEQQVQTDQLLSVQQSVRAESFTPRPISVVPAGSIDPLAKIVYQLHLPEEDTQIIRHATLLQEKEDEEKSRREFTTKVQKQLFETDDSILFRLDNKLHILNKKNKQQITIDFPPEVIPAEPNVRLYRINSQYLIANITGEDTSKQTNLIVDLQAKRMLTFPDLQCETTPCYIYFAKSFSPNNFLLIQNKDLHTGCFTTYRLSGSPLLLKSLFTYGTSCASQESRQYIGVLGKTHFFSKTNRSLITYHETTGAYHILIEEDQFPNNSNQILIDETNKKLYLIENWPEELLEGWDTDPYVMNRIKYYEYDVVRNTLSAQKTGIPPHEEYPYLPFPPVLSVPSINPDHIDQYFTVKSSILPVNIDHVEVEDKNTLLVDFDGDSLMYDGKAIGKSIESAVEELPPYSVSKLLMLNAHTLMFELTQPRPNPEPGEHVNRQTIPKRVGMFETDSGKLSLIGESLPLFLDAVDPVSHTVLTHLPIYHYYSLQVFNTGSLYRLINLEQKKIVNQFIIDDDTSNYGPDKPELVGPNMYPLLEKLSEKNQYWTADSTQRNLTFANATFSIHPEDFSCQNNLCLFTVLIEPHTLKLENNQRYETKTQRFQIDNSTKVTAVNSDQ